VGLRSGFEEIPTANAGSVLRELPDAHSLHTERARAGFEDGAEPRAKSHRARCLRGGQLGESGALRGQAPAGFLERPFRLDPELGLTLSAAGRSRLRVAARFGIVRLVCGPSSLLHTVPAGKGDAIRLWSRPKVRRLHGAPRELPWSIPPVREA